MGQQRKEFLDATFYASTLANIIGRFISHPIDTIKSKMQINRSQMRKLSDFSRVSPKAIVLETYSTEGIRGFFRGASISVFGSIVAFNAYMRVYEEIKYALAQNAQMGSFVTHMVAGLAAEIVSSALWLPIDIIKERMQVQAQIKTYFYRSPWDAIQQIKLKEGIIGLYRAYGATLLLYGPFSAIFFGVYEELKRLLSKDEKYLWQKIVCSGGASAVAGLLTTPLQITKLRMQVQRGDVAHSGGQLKNSIFGYRNVFHGLYKITQEEGFLALYKGASMRMLFVVPAVTSTISLTEYFRQLLLDNYY